MIDNNMIKKCYQRLIDEESKEIYTDRILYNMTGDNRYMQNIIFKKDVFRDLRDRIRHHQENGQKLILFGAGNWILGGKPIVDYYGGYIECFADNDQNKNVYFGYPVISFKELEQKYKNDVIMISTWFGKDEIYNQLINAGFQEENIINLPYITDYYINRQYFDIPYLTHDKNEVFMDCGSADGNTSHMFVKWCSGEYDYICV